MIVLDASYKHVDRHQSRASDKGTTKRTIQHCLTRVRNTLAVQEEIVDTQAVAVLLHIPINMTSGTFHFYGSHDAVDFVNSHLNTDAR